MSLSLNIQGYEMSTSEEEMIKDLTTLPKLNLLNGEVIEMTGGADKTLLIFQNSTAKTDLDVRTSQSES